VVAHLSAVNDPASHILTSAPAIDMDLDLDFDPQPGTLILNLVNDPELRPDNFTLIRS
jgi:hypothetical protein